MMMKNIFYVLLLSLNSSSSYSLSPGMEPISKYVLTTPPRIGAKSPDSVANSPQFEGEPAQLEEEPVQLEYSEEIVRTLCNVYAQGKPALDKECIANIVMKLLPQIPRGYRDPIALINILKTFNSKEEYENIFTQTAYFLGFKRYNLYIDSDTVASVISALKEIPAVQRDKFTKSVLDLTKKTANALDRLRCLQLLMNGCHQGGSTEVARLGTLKKFTSQVQRLLPMTYDLDQCFNEMTILSSLSFEKRKEYVLQSALDKENRAPSAGVAGKPRAFPLF